MTRRAAGGFSTLSRLAVVTLIAVVLWLVFVAPLVRHVAAVPETPSAPRLPSPSRADDSAQGVAPATVQSKASDVAASTEPGLLQPHLSDAVDKVKSGGRLLNGVVLFLYGGRWHSYFVRECLPRLDRYLLSCFPYPVHVFHEGATPSARSAITRAAPHASRVDFEDVGSIWKSLPHGITEDRLQRWMNTGVQPHFAKRGYRIMCRFWFGLVWRLPSMDRYDYYWRLDTDSVLTKPVLQDPFAHVFRDRGCVYGFNKVKGENMLVATGIFDEFLKWAAADGRSVVTEADVARVRDFAINKTTGKYWAPIFFNNFEMGSFEMKRSEPYQGFFKFIDSHEPYGIFRYRWGDAPLHTLGVVASTGWARICNVTQDVVGYKHAQKRPLPIDLTAPLACASRG